MDVDKKLCIEFWVTKSKVNGLLNFWLAFFCRNTLTLSSPIPLLFTKMQDDETTVTTLKFRVRTKWSLIKDKRKRKRSDSVLCQKPLHSQKHPQSKLTTYKTSPKTSISQRLRTDLGRLVYHRA